jgi:hypothetical protein
MIMVWWGSQLGVPVTEVVFVSALVSWIYFRLYKFPMKLLRAAMCVLLDGHLLVPEEEVEEEEEEERRRRRRRRRRMCGLDG